MEAPLSLCVRRESYYLLFSIFCPSTNINNWACLPQLWHQRIDFVTVDLTKHPGNNVYSLTLNIYTQANIIYYLQYNIQKDVGKGTRDRIAWCATIKLLQNQVSTLIFSKYKKFCELTSIELKEINESCLTFLHTNISILILNFLSANQYKSNNLNKNYENRRLFVSFSLKYGP